MDNYSEYENNIINKLIENGKNGNYNEINTLVSKEKIPKINSINYYLEEAAYDNKLNFETCYNIIYGSNNDEFKKFFASKIIYPWINFYINNPNETLKEQCQYFISFMSNSDISFIIKRNIDNTISKLITVFSLFNCSQIMELKNDLFFNEIDCLNYMINTYGHYNKDTVIKTIIMMGTQYYFINDDIVKWIINNYENYLSNEVEYILTELIKCDYNANVNYTNYIIQTLMLYFDISSKTKLNILKKSIYYNNDFTYNLIISNIVNHFNIDNNKLFKLIYLNINRNLPINSTFIINTVDIIQNIDKNIMSNLYKKLVKKGFNNTVQWLDKYFDNNFNPLFDTFFIINNIDVNKKEENNNECMICYDTPDKIITLGCHNTHNVCMSCIKIWYSNNTTCPMCRENIDLSKSVINI